MARIYSLHFSLFSMARIISFINQKGGTGKSTSAVNTAAYLAHRGKYVLLIDLDPQANATSGLGFAPQKLDKSLYDVLTQGDLPDGIIQRTQLTGYDLLPSSYDLAGASIELVNVPRREFVLADIIRKIRHNYDYVIIDSPPSLGLLTVNGLVASEYVVIPVQCEYYALEGLGQLLNTIEMIKANIAQNIQVLGVLLTMFDRRNRLSWEVEKELRRNYPGRVFEAVVPRNISLAEAPSFGKTILEHDPLSRGATAYRLLADEIIQLTTHTA